MLTRLATGLACRGHELLIGLLGEGWLSEHLRQARLDVCILPLRTTPDFAWIAKVAALVRRERVDIIHAHEFAMNAYGTLVATLVGVPVVTTVHGRNYYGGRWRRRLAYRLVARRAAMVAVSRDIRAYLEETIGVRRGMVVTIYNGVDTEAFRPNEEARRRTRRALGLGEQELVMGSVGSLYPVKGHAVLVEALARLGRGFAAVPLLLIGRGGEEARLLSMARDLGVGSQVRFLGLRSDIPELLAALDVFVLPSLSEGTPLSILEAMAVGVPVVASAVGGIPEIVEDGETGYLVESGSVEALVLALRRLLADRDARLRLGARARQRVETAFSLAAMVDAYEELYGLARG